MKALIKICHLQVVYGGANSVAGSEESRVMSEKVQMLASAIYKEFELMIRKHGQESVKVCLLKTIFYRKFSKELFLSSQDKNWLKICIFISTSILVVFWLFLGSYAISC